MPELPEVETVCRGLAGHIICKSVTYVTVRNAALRQPVPRGFAAALQGTTIRSITRRAKYILIDCSDNITLLVHLGMSGSIVIHTKPPSSYRKHDHVVIGLSDGSQLVYHDPRRFGVILPCNTRKLNAHPLLSHLGPEPLSPEWTATHLHESLKTRKAPIKSAIMDQKLVVGVGNIYACEALFMTGIHPARLASNVSKQEAAKLHRAIRTVLEAAIESGGSTLRDYVRSSGDAGYFQHHFRVYDRKNEPCEQCRTLIVALRQAGRSSFFCPSCQK